jgi:hypothetical protein
MGMESVAEITHEASGRSSVLIGFLSAHVIGKGIQGIFRYFHLPTMLRSGSYLENAAVDLSQTCTSSQACLDHPAI